jgi:hypothetical protein
MRVIRTVQLARARAQRVLAECRVGALLCPAISIVVVGCGSGASPSTAGSSNPLPAGNAFTSVTLVVTGTANDQLSEFDIEFQKIALIRQSGASITVLTASASQAAEFVHVNGDSEPLLSATIPSDVYTGATVTVGTAAFTCIGLTASGGLLTSTYVYGQTPTSDVTVTLPAPISVQGASMGLALNMLVTPSATYSQCQGAQPGSSYAIAPTFTLSSFAVPAAASPGTASAGVVDLAGQISSLDPAASRFELQLPRYLNADPATTVHVTADGTTVWQGIAGFAALGKGTFVDLDGTLHADGSLQATRVAVADSAAVNVQRGLLLQIASAVPQLMLFPRQAQGRNERVDIEAFRFNTGIFRISGDPSNLQSLPFTPTFDAASMVPGQNVSISSGAFATTGNYLADATTITLMPQTINGTIVGSAGSGRFTIYRVALSDYDLFPSLATQAGQSILLTDPATVEVYVDGNTAIRSSAPPAPGAVLRFHGLVFDDNGVLRMACTAVSDGVSGSSQLPPPVT